MTQACPIVNEERLRSAASDINLLGAVEMQKFINRTGMDAKIFGLVHDSILAEVPEDEMEIYWQIIVEHCCF